MIKSGRNLETDRLRGIAILMTMYIHYSRVFFPWNINPVYVHNNSIANLFSYCWTGVDLFLVISGYIISKTLISQIDLYKADINQLALTIRGFYLKRIYRLYPVKWVVFLLVLLCAVFFNNAGYFSSVESLIEVGVSIFLSIFNYYFVTGLYHEFSLQPYWSLAVEEQFYFIAPLFFIFIRNNKHRVIVILCLLLLITFY